ncbi:MAG: hypothetical protein IDH49_01670 [Gammaproteobacteria bacterium]|nr:hypothetical protein [Gammaproteobacteria bacterium]
MNYVIASTTRLYFRIGTPAKYSESLSTKVGFLMRVASRLAVFWLAVIFPWVFHGGIAVAAEKPFVVGLAGSINDSPAAIAAAKWAGARSVRLDAPWAQIERAPNKYAIPPWLDAMLDAMERNGIEPLLILDYGNPIYNVAKPTRPDEIAAFSRYAEWLVGRLRGRVKMYQLWNEWNADTGRTPRGTADDYVQLARYVYPRLKSIAPEITILGGSISNTGLRDGWIDRYFALGGHTYADGIGIHPYPWYQRGDFTPEDVLRLVDSIAAKGRNANAGRDIAIYITETGWSTQKGKFGTDPEMVAAYIVRFYLLASARKFVKGIWWYCIRNQGSETEYTEHNFGIFDQKLVPKPAANGLREVSKLLPASGDRPEQLRWSQGFAVRLSPETGGAKRIVAWQDNNKLFSLNGRRTTLYDGIPLIASISNQKAGFPILLDALPEDR